MSLHERTRFKEIYASQQEQIRKNKRGIFLNITWEKLIDNDDDFFNYLKTLRSKEKWDSQDYLYIKAMLDDELGESLNYFFNGTSEWEKSITKI